MPKAGTITLTVLVLTPFIALYLTYRHFYEPAWTESFLKTEDIPRHSESRVGHGGEERTCKKSLQRSNSTWFNERFDTRVPVSWSVDNIPLAQDTERWWLTLQQAPQTRLRPTFEELHKLGVPRHMTLDNDSDGCLSCAVVGNSANLKGSGYGEFIDSHDVVIRFNRAPTLRFEKDVGTKTTLHVMYPESAKSLQPGVGLTLIPFKPLDVQWLLSAMSNGNITRTYQPVQRWLQCDASKVVVVNPEFMKYVHTNWLGRHGRYASTGIMGIIMALHKCDSVDIFGFGADKTGAWQHYWEVLSYGMAAAFKKTGVHDGNFESELIKRLETEKIASVHRGIA